MESSSPLSLLLAKPFLHLVLGMREMTGTQLQKIVSLSPPTPPKPHISLASEMFGLTAIGTGTGIDSSLPERL